MESSFRVTVNPGLVALKAVTVAWSYPWAEYRTKPGFEAAWAGNVITTRDRATALAETARRSPGDTTTVGVWFCHGSCL